jgi:accessory gene regulator protein AgrB
MTPPARKRELAHSRHLISTAKLVVTLSVAIAATFVSTALKHEEGVGDDAGVALMLVTLFITIVVVAFAPSPPKAEEVSGLELRRFRRWARWAHRLMVLQVLTSSLSVAAVIFVQRPEWQTWFLPWRWH